MNFRDTIHRVSSEIVDCEDLVYKLSETMMGSPFPFARREGIPQTLVRLDDTRYLSL